jgi:nucleoside-diphosphate-sugar epimerase
VLDRQFDTELRSRWAGQVTLVEGDVNAEVLAPLDYDAYVHGAALTASPQESGMSPVANLRANTDPLFAVVDAAGPDRRGILISSDAAFRHTSGPVDETAQPFPLGTYAIAKRTTEFLAETLRENHGYDLTVIRLGSVYGVEERGRASRPRVSRVGQWVNAALADGTLTVHDPDARHDWTLASDIGRAVCALLNVSPWPSAVYNVASGEVLSNREVAEAIQAALPNTQMTYDDTPEPPHPRLGYLVSQRLRDEIGFADWTPFADGVRQIVRAVQVEG